MYSPSQPAYNQPGFTGQQPYNPQSYSQSYSSPSYSSTPGYNPGYGSPNYGAPNYNQSGFSAVPGYTAPPNPQYSIPQPMITPELKARFDAIDADHSGSIGPSEIVKAISTPDKPLPLNAARMLCRIFSQSGSIRIENFASFDTIITNIYNAFTSADYQRIGSLDLQQSIIAMNQLMLPNVNELGQSIVSILGENGRLTYPNFITACSVMMLSKHLMTTYDKTGKGAINLDLKNLITFALYFM